MYYYETTKLIDELEALTVETGETIFILHYKHACKYRKLEDGYNIGKKHELRNKIEKIKKNYKEMLYKTVECQYDAEYDKLRVNIEAYSEKEWYAYQEILNML